MAAMAQFGLPFDWPTKDDGADFIVTSANEMAVRHLDAWGNWPVRSTLLVGPRKSGKSLLGRIFIARSGGRLIDDAEARSEEELFHAWNEAQESRFPLLLISSNAPSEWSIALPDLRSRLHATPTVQIQMPDIDLMSALLVKALAKRGLVLMPDIANFAAAQIERSYIAVMRAADALDEASLSQKRAITHGLVKNALAQAGLVDRKSGCDETFTREAEHGKLPR
jgi:Bacterial dnaA  protein